MGFYNDSTKEGIKIKRLTGEVNLSQNLKNELERRGIPINKGYNIQKRLITEVEQGKLTADKIESRLMELLDERTKNEVTNDYIKDMSKPSSFGVAPRPDENTHLLKEIIMQNNEILKQNKIIIKELQKLNKED